MWSLCHARTIPDGVKANSWTSPISPYIYHYGEIRQVQKEPTHDRYPPRMAQGSDINRGKSVRIFTSVEGLTPTKNRPPPHIQLSLSPFQPLPYGQTIIFFFFQNLRRFIDEQPINTISLSLYLSSLSLPGYRITQQKEALIKFLRILLLNFSTFPL